MREWHRPRMRALVEAGVDLLALETIPCQEEAEMLCDLLREFPNMKAWLSFSCRVSIPNFKYQHNLGTFVTRAQLGTEAPKKPLM